MSDDGQPSIIPFGKHKGKTVEEVQIVEPSYLDWLIAQPGFRDRHVILYQTIINRGVEPEDTPDHNALQCLFLDDAFCLKVAAVIKCGGPNLRVTNRQFENRGIDVSFTLYRSEPYFHELFGIEIKPSVGDDYPTVLRQMNALFRPGSMTDFPNKILFLERYTGVGASVDQLRAIFKASRITVVFRHEVDQ